MRLAKPSDWEITELPLSRTTVRLDRFFSADEMEVMRRGVVPVDMDDRWFIYSNDGCLFIHRSWTGFCVYVVRFVQEGDGFRMVEAQLNRDSSQYENTNDEYDVKLISWLIDEILLQRESAFPTVLPSAGPPPE